MLCVNNISPKPNIADSLEASYFNLVFPRYPNLNLENKILRLEDHFAQILKIHSKNIVARSLLEKK